MAAVIFAAALVLNGVTSVGEAAFLAVAQQQYHLRVSDSSLNAQMLKRLIASQARTEGALLGTRLALGIIAVVCIVALVAPRNGVPWGGVAGAVLFTVGVFLATTGMARKLVRPAGPTLALAAAPWLFVVYLVAAPLAWAVGIFTPRDLPRSRSLDVSHSPQAGVADMATSRNGPLPHDEQERRMIQSILELDSTTAREIMTPRVDLVALPADAPPSEIVEAMSTRGHSRIPVYDGTVDHIVGVIYARDYLKAVSTPGPTPSLRQLARSTLFVPETKRLNELLKEFQHAHVHIAIVVDEYGGTAGIVTIEDLLEEIVGELSDEFAHDEPQVQVVSDSQAVVHARTGLDTVNDLFGSSLQSEDVDTVGGFLFGLLGKMPAVGDKGAADGLQFEVAELVGRRIRKVRVTRQEETEQRPGRTTEAEAERSSATG